MADPLSGKHILLGITGGIAAYKSPALVRLLRQAGADVQVVLTQSAARFVTPTTLQAVTGKPVRTDLWDEAAEAAMGHIELARWADAILIAPATADVISRLATGRADDLLCTLCLASRAPKFLAPAMNQVMWSSPATARNLAQLTADGVTLLGPDTGHQACGEFGPGRMTEPDSLVEQLARALAPEPVLAGRRVLITAGPTREAIDPVRYISNSSSGKQGFALAAAARAAGASVQLVSGPVALPTPAGVERIDVVTAREMHEAVMARAPACDLFIGVAAVADYRPAQSAGRKLKKTERSGELTLDLVENPDIIASVAALGGPRVVVGFAAETHDALPNARDKLRRKGLDMIVVNDVSEPGIGFDGDENAATLIWAKGEVTVGRVPKSQLARSVIETIATVFVDQLAPANPERVAK